MGLEEATTFVPQSCYWVVDWLFLKPNCTSLTHVVALLV